MSTPAPLHKAIICVDIERFSDPGRKDPAQLAMRKGLYESLKRAFVTSEIHWDEGYHEDRGDGVLFLVRQNVSQARLVEPLPFELAVELARHNQHNKDRPENRIRLRIAMDAGYVRHDPQGIVGSSVIRAFRLLDSRELKDALKDAPGDLACIASADFHRDVIRQRGRFDESIYRKVRVTDRDTYIDAWIWTSDVQLRAGQRYGETVAQIVTVLSSIDELLDTAREDRAVAGGKISSSVPEVPDLATPLRERLTALDGPREQRRWSDLITEVTGLEQAAEASLAEAHAAVRAVRAPLERRDELRGLLKSYQAMAREAQRVEEPNLDELYQRAHDLLWTAPCDLPEAETATMRYVREVQEESAS